MELPRAIEFAGASLPLDVSIVMPCLNEIHSLRHCVANAQHALDQIMSRFGLAGEIVIADNGSTDGSQALAISLGARVVNVERKGYGAAIIGGFDAAFGQFLVMGDCDGSYDFTDSVAMVARLLDGADLCMGSRFKGGIAAGSMPWKNRYIGNPLLTGILNLFFRSGIDDAHCGLRAIRKQTYSELGLQGAGMEFASEMVIKASLRKMRIDQVPATLSPDLRDRAPHLRPWRDGWRHLRYLLMLSPTWVFGIPALLAMTLACLILSVSALHALNILPGSDIFGASWAIIGGFLLTLGHFAGILALTTHFHGVKLGYRPLRPAIERLAPVLTLEHAIVSAGVLMVISFLASLAIGISWARGGFVAPPSVLPVVLAAATGAIGIQTALGGFVLAIVAGHDARFCPSNPPLAFETGSNQRQATPSPVAAAPLAAVTLPRHGVFRLGRYTVVSAICLVIQNTVLISSDFAGMHYAAAVLLSTAILVPVGFLLQAYFTFAVEPTLGSLLRYAAAMALSLPASLVLAWLFCGQLSLPMAIASPLISICLYGWNYLSSSWALAGRSKSVSVAA